MVSGMALVISLSACTIGAPPGFSSGDSWSVPVVGPLENGVLVVPVMIHEHGPYLFAIDTDAPTSSLDAALDSELGLHSRLGGEWPDESDVARRIRWAEVLRMSIGTLRVRKLDFMVMPVGTFNQAGRQIRGVIGRDILADSLVFGFDRDLGMAYLATKQGFTAPAGAVRFEYDLLKHGAGMHRHLVTARINGHALRLHVDLGEVASQLRPGRFATAGLEAQPLTRTLVDEYGTTRAIERGAVAAEVEVAGARAHSVLFVPYGDRRWREVDLDGTLGLGFFEDYAVWNDFDDHVVHLVPRTHDDVTAQRLARWGWAALAGCANPGCARAEVIEAPSEDGAPAEPPLLMVERDPSTLDVAIELTLEARLADGRPAGLPLLVASFPAKVQRATRPLDASFRGLSFAVVDLSPYPRACAGERACIYGFRADP